MFAGLTFGAVLADKAKRTEYRGSTARYRSYESGVQDRLNGFAPQSADDDYFRGYCEQVCNEIDAEAGRNTRATWWGEAD